MNEPIFNFIGYRLIHSVGSTSELLFFTATPGPPKANWWRDLHNVPLHLLCFLRDWRQTSFHSPGAGFSSDWRPLRPREPSDSNRLAEDTGGTKQ